MTLSAHQYIDHMLWFCLDTIFSQPESTFRFVFMQAYTFFNVYILNIQFSTGLLKTQSFSKT